MKLFIRYLKHHVPAMLAFLLCVIIFTVTLCLYRLPVRALIYPAALCLALLFGFALFDYVKMRKRHKELVRIKSLSSALMGEFPEPDSVTDDDYREIIMLLRQEQRAAADKAEAEFRDMVDYYTVWAHQIKLPIAAMKLTLQNEDSDRSRRLRYELGRIERYVEMVLTYLRLDSDSTDYVIREYKLDDIVKAAIRKFASDFIGKRIGLSYTELNTTVTTDEKWLGFVIEQVLSNALKYTHEGSVSIYMENGRTLCIRDTGIGIAAEDLPRVFENGFTGINGRIDKNASGIGLYLCRRICTKLGHGISAESDIGSGTTIRIDFM